MASVTLKGGLYLKDTPYQEITGTWTGFVDVNGRSRLLVAIEESAVSDNDDLCLLMFALREVCAYNDFEFTEEGPDGGRWLVFMPPDGRK